MEGTRAFSETEYRGWDAVGVHKNYVPTALLSAVEAKDGAACFQKTYPETPYLE